MGLRWIAVGNNAILMYNKIKDGGEILEVISKRLKHLREDAGLSQSKIGQLVGVPQSSIYRYEQGQSTPSPKTFRWYADYFDVSLDYLFGRTEDPHGAHYEYRPKYETLNPEMEKFVEMCFEPGSPINERLKETLTQMLSSAELTEKTSKES